jgi:murein DD-endopeptidase MepM/ murein hydrolase activator NlpD
VLRLRTTSRGFLIGAIALGAAGAVALPAGAADALGRTPRHHRAVPALVFPVVGPVSFRDDFGEPRSHWSHPGNDIVAAKRSLVLAVEGGTVREYTRSASAGCMLYLYGDSGTMYEYIHLNNDAGAGNDNRGGCVAGVAWAPGLEDGQRVEAGQPIGFVGDSGDANGIAAHLHFEVHPGGGAAVTPYPYLVAARRAG